MSAADIITDPTYPHGTTDGYRGGCKSGACPAPVTCRVVHVRYIGDFAFRRQVDAGMTPAEIVAAEQEHAIQVAEAERKARRARPGKRAGMSEGDRRPAANRARAGARAVIPRDTLRELLDEGLTDRQIADRLGLERRQVTGTRNAAGFPRNPDRNRRAIPTETPATAGVSSSREGSAA